MTTRIGLFGGSFDPVHNAHLALARTALDALALDEVRWIPAGQPWQKDRAMTPGAQREAMVRLAIADEPRFVLERCELQRQGPSFTLDTVRELHAALPGAEFTLIIGHDQYAGMHTWHGWRELLGLVQLAVAARPGALVAAQAEVLNFSHRSVPLPMQDISSSAIRRRIANGHSIEHLVPPRVARYIEQQALYRAAPRRAMDIRKLQRAIVDGLEDVKGQNISVFNTEHLSAMFERVIIASGTSNRQTKALASSVRDSVKSRGMQVLRTEGEDNAEWIIVDCGAAVAHIMQPAIRDYYHLEEIWGGKAVRMKVGPATAGLVKASEPAAPAGRKKVQAKKVASRRMRAGKPAGAAAKRAPARKATRRV